MNSVIKIYHNPRCRKSRAGLEYLKLKDNNIEVVDYLKTGLNKEIIQEILLKTNLHPIDLVRTQEEIYKKELRGKSFTDEEWIKIICENPKLLVRPIVLSNRKAVIGDPVENINILIITRS